MSSKRVAIDSELYDQLEIFCALNGGSVRSRVAEAVEWFLDIETSDEAEVEDVLGIRKYPTANGDKVVEMKKAVGAR